ncbi:MAG TPA: winged helix-turn-helix domain-containing protein [Solirubrobacteraceae bacterium]
MTVINDITDPRLVKALAHPIRVRALQLLEGRTLTPKQIAAELDLPLENVSYHVRTLAKFGLIKLERRRMGRRGAVEHLYRTASRPRITADTWEQLPESVKEAMTGAILGQVVHLATAALSHEGFARPDSHISRRPVVVDEEGFGEISAILTKALDDVTAAEERAGKRLQREDEEGIRATLVAMLFEAAPPDSTDGGLPADAEPAVRRGKSGRGRPGSRASRAT